MPHRPRLLLPLLFVFALGCQDSGRDGPTVKIDEGPVRVYVGTYTGKASKGIYVMEMDRKTGALTEPRLAAETKSPSFLALRNDQRVLYAVGETDSFDGKKTGSVAAFAINDDGTLKKLNEQPSGGTGPCHVD